jgi:hypothetical protein
MSGRRGPAPWPGRSPGPVGSWGSHRWRTLVAGSGCCSPAGGSRPRCLLAGTRLREPRPRPEWCDPRTAQCRSIRLQVVSGRVPRKPRRQRRAPGPPGRPVPWLRLSRMPWRCPPGHSRRSRRRARWGCPPRHTQRRPAGRMRSPFPTPSSSRQSDVAARWVVPIGSGLALLHRGCRAGPHRARHPVP